MNVPLSRRWLTVEVAADVHRPSSKGKLGWPELLLDAASLRPGQRVLVLAREPDQVVDAVAGRDAPGQISTTNMTFAALDQQLKVDGRTSFEDAHFDIVLSAFGLMEVSHPRLAIQEIRRILVPEGHGAALEWAPLDHASDYATILPWLAAVQPPLQRRASSRLQDQLMLFLRAKGGVDLDILPCEISFASVDHALDAMESSWGGIEGANSQVMLQARRIAPAYLAPLVQPDGRLLFGHSVAVLRFARQWG